MKKIMCEMCGSSSIKKITDDLFECEHCGIKYSKADVQKLFVEVSGKVRIDDSEKVKNLYMLARADIDKNNCGNALRYYESILLEEPTSWEATFFVEYINVVNSNAPEFFYQLRTYKDTFPIVLNMVKTQLKSHDEQLSALDTICHRTEKLSNVCFRTIKAKLEQELEWQSQYSEAYRRTSFYTISDMYEDRCLKNNNDREAVNKYRLGFLEIASVLTDGASCIEKKFSGNNKVKECVFTLLKPLAENSLTLLEYTDDSDSLKFVREQIAKVKKYAPDYSMVEEIRSLSAKDKAVIDADLQKNYFVHAVKQYSRITGKDLDDAKRDIQIYSLENGFNVSNEAVTHGTDSWIMYLMLACIIPPAAIPCYPLLLVCINKAKNENGGILKQKTKKYIIIASVLSAIWFCGFAGLFLSIYL